MRLSLADDNLFLSIVKEGRDRFNEARTKREEENCETIIEPICNMFGFVSLWFQKVPSASFYVR